MACSMEPQAAIWFSLIKKASNKPILWLTPPPQVTAYFCALRRPGKVLRVSSNLVVVPARCLTYELVMVAVPERLCKKFNAVRSPVNKIRALPDNSNNVVLAVTCCPSLTNQVILVVVL